MQCNSADSDECIVVISAPGLSIVRQEDNPFTFREDNARLMLKSLGLHDLTPIDLLAYILVCSSIQFPPYFFFTSFSHSRYAYKYDSEWWQETVVAGKRFKRHADRLRQEFS